MIEFIQPSWPAPANVRACCTTRSGGVSEPPYDSFNLALHVGDVDSRVLRNRQLLREQLGLATEPCWIRQTHGTEIVVAERDDGRDADGTITRDPARVAVVMVADCLPILLCNHEGTEVAAVHAGWRGLQAGVVQAAVERMHSSGDQLMAWIGPGISRDFFEVGDEVRAAFIASEPCAQDYFSASRDGHWMCDLPGLAERVLRQLGVPRVYRDGYCSYRDATRFYSYRRDAVTGRMAALIWIG